MQLLFKRKTPKNEINNREKKIQAIRRKDEKQHYKWLNI